MMIIDLSRITSFILFFLGVYGLVARRNIVKSIISIGIMETGIILFCVNINRTIDSTPPIGMGTADPLPHALMITAIVIGVAITAAALTMFIHMYHRYGTTNWATAKERRSK